MKKKVTIYIGIVAIIGIAVGLMVIGGSGISETPTVNTATEPVATESVIPA